MATNPPSGDGHRNGAVRSRSQTKTPSGHYIKRDADTGRFMDVKTSDKNLLKVLERKRTNGKWYDTFGCWRISWFYRNRFG